MCCHTQHHDASMTYWKQAVLHLLCLWLHRRGTLPDSCFRYRAIQQRAETSVKAPHPMAVHCLLHTVNCGTHTQEVKQKASLTISHTGVKTHMYNWEEHLIGLSFWTAYFCGCSVGATCKQPLSYNVNAGQRGLCRTSRVSIQQETKLI